MQRLVKKSIPLLYGACFNGLAHLSGSLTGWLAFRTFSKVRKGRVLPIQAQYLDHARHRREQVNGHTIQTYHWEGPGPTVLLVHGWESNSYRWHKLIEQLRQHEFDIKAFDAPGHGYSSGKYLHMPLYGECLLHMIKKYQPRHLVAHSMGGMTTLYIHHKYPDMGVERIVTLGSPSELSELMEHYRNLLKLSNRVMASLDDYVKQRFGFGFRDFSSSQFARNIPQKGLLIHDKHDPVTPFHASEKVHANWADSTLIATEGLGHSLHQDGVNKKIADFLKSPK